MTMTYCSYRKKDHNLLHNKSMTPQLILRQHWAFLHLGHPHLPMRSSDIDEFMALWFAGVLHLIFIHVSQQASYGGSSAISASVHGEGAAKNGDAIKHDMKCSCSAYTTPLLILQSRRGSSKLRTENLSIITTRRDQTSNQELLQHLEQTPKVRLYCLRPMASQTSDEIFP